MVIGCAFSITRMDLSRRWVGKQGGLRQAGGVSEEEEEWERTERGRES